MRITVAQPRAGGGDDPRAAAALVPQHLVLEAEHAAGHSCAVDGDERDRSATIPSSARYRLLRRRRRRRCSSATTRPTRARLFGVNGAQGYFKDAFHDYVVQGNGDAVNPRADGHQGGGALSSSTVPAGGAASQCGCGLTQRRSAADAVRATSTSIVRTQRRREADEFYADLQAGHRRRRRPQRAAAGVRRHDLEQAVLLLRRAEWLNGDPAQPPPPARAAHGRNSDWKHLNNADIISMPDKWEYPWYAAWDLAFHCIPLALIDAEFAKEQLVLLTREWYMHPNGQLPAYEWAFGDVNPPVHAWATWRVFQIDRKQRGDCGDLAFLERVFHKLMLNFTWWVNRKDAEGRNIFQGGFLGLDNIGVFDRSAPLPTGGFINQADGTSWMAMYCLNLMRIALELALHNHVYEDIATKFFEHFLHIAEAMTNIGGDGEASACGTRRTSSSTTC